MEDPAEATGTDEEKARAFDVARQLITRRIDLLLALPLEKLERLATETRVRAIGSEA
jgi:arsenate reductase